MVHEYELVIVAAGDLKDSDREVLVAQIKKVIEVEKGEVTNVEDWGKRELAYDIKKNASGFYTAFTFKGNSKTPGAVSSKLALFEELLRLLIVRKGSQKTENSKQRAESRE